jgi:hypothetical protein
MIHKMDQVLKKTAKSQKDSKILNITTRLFLLECNQMLTIEGQFRQPKMPGKYPKEDHEALAPLLVPNATQRGVKSMIRRRRVGESTGRQNIQYFSTYYERIFNSYLDIERRCLAISLYHH